MQLRPFLVGLWCAACATGPARTTQPGPVNSAPRAAREFRAAWVATVANINWPSAPGLPPEEQRREAIALLDRLRDLHFNAVILQVRPQADALYPSRLEPWSYYLTGEQGRAPEPAWDPLAFWIEAAHDRGLELHAWLNPFRAHHPTGGPVTQASLVRQQPELVVPLQDGTWWMDPALRATRSHSLAVVLDIVRRYDVDGVHFDDYFYPYPSYNGGKDFPDDRSWAAYQAGGGRLARDDWRRQSVNTFIRDVYRAIKREKPRVKFGLSPFGIWRPGFPETIEGFDQYAELYADARLWLRQGWVDYWTPQLYWPTNQIPQSFPVLLGWWGRENVRGRHLWPGINIGRIPGTSGADEAVSQIMITRGMVPDGPGNVHWSIGPLVRNDTLASTLLAGPYREQALVPASPWLGGKRPAAPLATVERSGDSVVVRWDHRAARDIFAWVVYYRVGQDWRYRILPRGDRLTRIRGPDQTAGAAPVPGPPPAIEEVAVSAVDRAGRESRFNVIAVPAGRFQRQSGPEPRSRQIEGGVTGVSSARPPTAAPRRRVPWQSRTPPVRFAPGAPGFLPGPTDWPG